MKELVHDVSYIAIDTSSRTIHDSAVSLDIQGMELVTLSGTLIDPERYWNLKYTDRLPEDGTVADIIDSSGEWSALAASGSAESREYLYFSDPSGFAPTFYSLLPNKALVISDSFSGVVQGVRRLGGNLSLNAENYVTVISGKTPTFQNLVSDATMANEIKILDYDNALVVTEHAVSTIDRRALSEAQAQDDYETVMELGIEIASKSIQRIVAANEGHNPIITLTGGVDSRIVLAILSASGLARKFSVWSMDPRQASRPQQKKVLTADVEIASELRRYYGLDWMKPRTRTKLSISFEEALAHYQSFNSNFSQNFVPANHISVDIEPILTLRGGGGETLRGGGGARITAERYDTYASEGGELDSISWASRNYLEQSCTTEETKRIAEGFLVKTLQKYKGNSLRETLDSYYRATRNRGHFGHARQSDSTGDRIMQVLANPFLLRAAELSGYDYKVSGKLVADLFNQTEPALQDFPFENPTATSQLTRNNGNLFKFKDRHSWKAEFDQRKRQALPVRYKTLWEPDARREVWDFSPVEQALNFSKQGLNRLLDTVSVDLRRLLEAQHNSILESLERGTLQPGPMSAKLASALDVFIPMPLSYPGVHFYTNPHKKDAIEPSSLIHNYSRPYMRG